MKEKSNILIFDIGLTNVKALVFQPDGTVLAQGHCNYPTYRRHTGHVEQRFEDWWEAILAANDMARAQNLSAHESVAGISLTAHMHTLVCLDGLGCPLFPALVLGDTRAYQESEKLKSSLGPENVYRYTGAPLDPGMPAAKAAWLRANHREIFDKTRVFTGCKGALLQRLSGRALIDPVDACATSMYDIGRCNWHSGILESIGLSEDCLPELTDAHSVAGPLSAECATAFGVTPGLPVITGAGDDIEILGCGLISPGGHVEHLGSTGSVLGVTDTLLLDPDMALECYPHVAPDLWVIGGSITSAGTALGWAMESLGFSDPEKAYALLADEPPFDGLVFLPHLQGERAPDYNARARGAWLGLTPDVTPRAMMRTTFEGVAFAMKRVMEKMHELTNSIPDTIHVSQGGALDKNWLQMRADIYEKQLIIPESQEPTALGAAILAAFGMGIYSDIHAATAAMARTSYTVSPCLHNDYARNYDCYNHMREALAPVWN